MIENEDFSDTTKPDPKKSNQLNADDLDNPMVIKITRAQKIEGDKQPMILHFEGCENRPFKPCLTMRRLITRIWGKKGGYYVGQSIELHRDPSVTFGPNQVGGIRINKMTGIDRPKIEIITVSKIKKSPFRVEPLIIEDPAPTGEALTDEAFILWSDMMSISKTNEELLKIAADIKAVQYDEEGSKRLNAAYSVAFKALKEAEAEAPNTNSEGAE